MSEIDRKAERTFETDEPVQWARRDAWQEIAEGARVELEKWAESRRDRRRARPRGSPRTME